MSTTGLPTGLPTGTTYHARADADRALALAGTTSPFTITVRFLDGLTPAQQDAFAGAADRWARVIVGDLPPVTIDGVEIDDVLIFAQGTDLGGPGGTLGDARIVRKRPPGDRPSALLPTVGLMRFDQADLVALEERGALGDVILHEMGHVLGVGSLWDDKGLLTGAGGPDPRFTGRLATAEYRAHLGASDLVDGVPVENSGGLGTRDVHWRDDVFANELMTGFVNRPPNPLSRITVASLADLGYQVDMDAADVFVRDVPVALRERTPCHAVIAAL